MMDMDDRELIAVLERIGSHLQRPARLVLIGSSVGMFHGQPSRMTEDIDVWRPSSQMDDADLRAACQAAGVLYDPKEVEIGEDMPYLQLISPGIVQIGDYKTELRMAQFGNLEVVHPPIENVIASKLLRAEPRDIEDVVFLRRKFEVSYAAIEAVIDGMPAERRELARENIVYLEVADSRRVQVGGDSATNRDEQAAYLGELPA